MGRGFESSIEARDAGQKTKKHGLYAVAERGAAALETDEAKMSFLELKQAVRDPAVRDELAFELFTRLTIMWRVGFDEMMRLDRQGIDPFSSPVVRALGSYLTLWDRLRRSFPRGSRDEFMEELKRIQSVIEAHRDAENETVVAETPMDDSDDPEAVQSASEPDETEESKNADQND